MPSLTRVVHNKQDLTPTVGPIDHPATYYNGLCVTPTPARLVSTHEDFNDQTNGVSSSVSALDGCAITQGFQLALWMVVPHATLRTCALDGCATHKGFHLSSIERGEKGVHRRRQARYRTRKRESTVGKHDTVHVPTFRTPPDNVPKLKLFACVQFRASKAPCPFEKH